MGVWESSAELDILVCGEVFQGRFLKLATVASAAPLFCAGIAREKADTSADDCCMWLVFTRPQ